VDVSYALRLVIPFVALVAGLAGFWYFVPRAPSFGMFAGEGEINVARVGLSFAATITGVILGSFYRQLRALQTVGQKTIEAPLRFRAVAEREEIMRPPKCVIGSTGSTAE